MEPHPCEFNWRGNGLFQVSRMSQNQFSEGLVHVENKCSVRVDPVERSLSVVFLPHSADNRPPFRAEWDLNRSPKPS